MNNRYRYILHLWALEDAMADHEAKLYASGFKDESSEMQALRWVVADVRIQLDENMHDVNQKFVAQLNLVRNKYIH